MKNIVGIMGPGKEATPNDLRNAYVIGRYCAGNGWVVLTGGRKSGVMDEGLRGAKENGGLTVGILPNDDLSQISEHCDIPIITNARSGRNFFNVLSSNILVACGMSHGTSSEVSLALACPGKKVILVGTDDVTNTFYKKMAGEQVIITKDYKDACAALKRVMAHLKYGTEDLNE